MTDGMIVALLMAFPFVGTGLIYIWNEVIEVKIKDFIQDMKEFREYKREADKWLDDYPVEEYLAKKYN